MTFALGARAAQYVFYYSGNYMYVNNDGQLASTTTFSTACIWEGTSGNKFYAVNSNGRTYYLRYNNGLTVTNNQNNATNWTVNENNLYFQSRTSGGIMSTSYYRSVRYNNGWGISDEETKGWFDSHPSFNSDCNVLYLVTTRTVESKTDTELTPATANVTLNPSTVELEKINDRAEFQATAPTITQKTYTIPEHKTYTFNNITYYQLGSTLSTTEPTGNLTSSVVLNPTYHWNLSSGGNTYLDAGADGGTGWVQKKANPNADTEVIVSVWAVYGDNAYTTPTTTATITVMSEKYNPTGITAEPLMLEVGGTGSITYILEPTGAKDEITYSGYGNTIISIDANGVVTGLKAGITEVTLTAKKLDGTNGPTTTSNVTVMPKAPTIEFALGANITATISTTETGATIYYTTDGTTPTTRSYEYTAPVSVTAGATVKAIVVVTANGTPLTSPVAEALANVESGIVGNTVFLYDLEDHNWTYYSGVDASVDGGNYNTNYKGKIYSPNPRNVKITYNGVNGISGSSTNVKVSISENENSFVYYKTLEQGSTQGEYPYTVISNPFSVRPSTGTGNGKVYYGFVGWKIVKGGEFIKNYDNGSTLPLDAEIVFEKLPYSSVNCISAEIVFETTWTQANVQTGNDISTMLSRFSGGTYETNFAVLTGQYTTAWTGNKNATITSVYPDGSTDSRNGVSTRLNLTLNDGYTIKYEYIHINNSNSTFTMGSGTKMLYLGRGISNTANNGVCCNLIQGFNNNIASGGLTYTLKIESGIYNYISFAAGTEGSSANASVTGTVSITGILGCDYDRAGNNNNNLKIQEYAIFGYGNDDMLKTPSAGDEVLNVTLKSGSLNSNKTSAGTADVDDSFYIGIGGGYSPGYRKFTMEGGEMWSLAAGLCENTATTNSIFFRIKGGLIKGSIYGSAANANSYGYKQMVITGGHIKGWVAGGGNGTSANGGVTTGSSYIYVGGNSRVDSEGSDTKINSSLGGQVFGSGSGVENTTTWGEMTYGSNVVVADNAYIERTVYGGGNFGWSEDCATIYITGEKASVGSVYGGANQNKGETVKIYMNGGLVREGVYGGSNTTGTISGNVTMQFNGGQVGTSSKSANIHGGGYGQNTRVSGNVEVTLGTENQATGGVTVYGDVYGGSALGYVNGTTATNTYHTHVTMNKGTIYGSLYGGALGSKTVAANVYGPVEVKVHGGSVKKVGDNDGSGGVYGANNINGAPQRSVTVDIYGTDPAPAENQYALHAVYGGGNQAPYTYGNGYPKVAVHNCDNSIEYVYGGGNAAEVASTDVTIWGGDVIGNVFGGGNGESGTAADVNGDAVTKIYGGTILNVYGGSNSKGEIKGDILLTVNSQQEPGENKKLCTMNIENVYGGGNKADSKVGSIDIGCTGTDGRIDNVYGGANAADVNSDIDLHINGGNIGNVFGGNNQSGNISGTITVTVGNDPNDCGVFQVDNVYGGGNLAAYSAPEGKKDFPVVNMVSGTVNNAIYGGGLGTTAIVKGNPQVKMTGGSVGRVTTTEGVTTITGDIFGGGNAAAVEGNTSVVITNGEVKHNVYGGGNQAKVTGKTNVVIGE